MEGSASNFVTITHRCGHPVSLLSLKHKYISYIVLGKWDVIQSEQPEIEDEFVYRGSTWLL